MWCGNIPMSHLVSCVQNLCADRLRTCFVSSCSKLATIPGYFIAEGISGVPTRYLFMIEFNLQSINYQPIFSHKVVVNKKNDTGMSTLM